MDVAVDSGIGIERTYGTSSKRGQIAAFLLFLLPVSFIFEKRYFQFSPLYIGEHVYFYISIALMMVLFVTKRTLRVGVFLPSLLIVSTLSFGLAAIIGYDLQVKPAISTLFSVVYLMISIFIMENSITNIKTFSIYVKGLTLAFYIIVAICAIQICAIWAVPGAAELNNAFADFYEARWAPFNIMGSVHFFYLNGSYATTQGRLNGLSPEASTFCIGLALTFAPVFIALSTKKTGNFSQIKYTFFVLIISGMLLIAKSSTGIALGAVVLALMAMLKAKTATSKIFLVFLIIIASIVSYGYIEQLEYVDKLSDINNVSTQTRYGTIVGGLYALAESPIIGRGTAFYYNVRDYIPTWGMSREIELYYDKNSVHIFFLPIEIWGEYGLYAFIALIYYLFKTIKNSYGCIFGSRNQSEIILFAFSVIVLISSVSTSQYVQPFFFFAFGLSYVMLQNGKSIFSNEPH